VIIGSVVNTNNAGGNIAITKRVSPSSQTAPPRKESEGAYQMSNGSKIIEGLADAVAHAQGGLVGVRERQVSVPDNIDVRAIRQKLGLTQHEFAIQFGFSLGTIRNWEQGTRVPPGAPRAFLTIIDREPEAVRRALSSKSSEGQPVI
jgi:putative transcriptional regulator